MKINCLLVLLFACTAVTNCINSGNVEKMKHRKKVTKKVRKYSNINTMIGNTTKEGNKRSSDSFSYSPLADYQSPSSYSLDNFESPSSHPTYQDDQNMRSLDSFEFLNGASISSQMMLHLPVPFCQFTDICKNNFYSLQMIIRLLSAVERYL